MGRRKKNYSAFHAYENPTPTAEHYIRITKDMIMHPNFIAMHNSSKVLYLYMRMWGYPKIDFEYSISMSRKIMSKKTFLNSIKELVNNGFLEIEFQDRYSRRPNVYKLSSNWYK